MLTISERLREERDAARLSQQALADLCGISLRSQQNYEKDRSPDAQYLASLAAHSLDVMYILTGNRERGPLLDAAETVLIDNYRRCSRESKANLVQTSALLAAGIASAAKPQRRKTEKLSDGSVNLSGMSMHNAGAGAVQIGHSQGKVTVKKGR
ncbi:Helix-turn-helix domain-containing protein [Paracidovorax valerianellae]|uniref:Helix-turn-helix domain-containing protein n=1 Tax=Paracidovorax valerianellae TaxID=187868 RepID=A0A1G6VTF3_9BURK|nr:helix-turn-helix transcriptional regulator [Paracidovorax valerianellae]SDD56892.1 Helix-turn-helix domain-containing protein [Paracidovorax valerianellae]